jgi:hypothetical protein
MMTSDMDWTTELGNAFLAQKKDVMDAVQRMRTTDMSEMPIAARLFSMK